MPAHGDGPIPSRIMLVGEAWGEAEEQKGRPFVGASGEELNRMLGEAGIMRSECYVTNLVNARPPENDLSHWIATGKSKVTPAHVPLRDKMVLPLVAEGHRQLLAEIALVQPNIIIAFGNWALWALTGRWGILKWRGSQLGGGEEPKVIPTIHPAAILREWSARASVLNDLRRAKREMGSRTYAPPAWDFQIRPSINQVLGVLHSLQSRLEAGEEIWIDFDVETRAGHIECFSISWSRLASICVPIMSYSGGEGYWSLEEEATIIHSLRLILTHPRASVRWQNGLYDAQYTHKDWHWIPRGGQDTMISQHTIFSDLPKALHFQASLYADWYVYWKDEGKTWNPKMPPEQRWRYNCMDCVYTREVGEVELATVEALGLGKVHEFQQAMFWPVLRAMLRGVPIIPAARSRLAGEVQEQISYREDLLAKIFGHPVNPRSPKQMASLFYTDLKQPVVMTRAKKGAPSRPTCDDEALTKIAAREPLLKAPVQCIQDIRTLEKFLDVILMKLDEDGRARCSYNIGGSESGKSAPKTYRLSSSKSAFGSGANLQNIPSEKSKSMGKAAARGSIAFLGDAYKMPNVRSLFGPDGGYTFFDMDLDRADLHVFVWEIDDPLYKEVLRKGIDAHLLHVYLLDRAEPPPLDELVETHPKYWDHRGPRKHKREFSKVFCHATDYVGGARTVAAHTGRTVHEIEQAQRRYLSVHPRIEPYWADLAHQIRSRRFVENRFGYRWYIFDRIDSILPEAVAWIPQSTVSIVINRIWMSLFQGQPETSWNLSADHLRHLMTHPANGIEVLLQVHDSLAGQFPTYLKQTAMAKIRELSKIVVPYIDPLIIPTSINTSEVSWGEC